jgi:hypothetical protein
MIGAYLFLGGYILLCVALCVLAAKLGPQVNAFHQWTSVQLVEPKAPATETTAMQP